jgi:hypothetical protein
MDKGRRRKVVAPNVVETAHGITRAEEDNPFHLRDFSSQSNIQTTPYVRTQIIVKVCVGHFSGWPILSETKRMEPGSIDDFFRSISTKPAYPGTVRISIFFG